MKLFNVEMFAYQLMPTDFFAGAIPIEKYLSNEIDDCGISQLNRIHHFMRCMYEMGRLVEIKDARFWEGDLRQGQGVYVFAVPSNDACLDIGYMWKQDNNGDTFAISPVEIKKLSDQLIGTFML
jgi:hypothetical protein